jgi:hypothetical protein
MCGKRLPVSTIYIFRKPDKGIYLRMILFIWFILIIIDEFFFFFLDTNVFNDTSKAVVKLDSLSEEDLEMVLKEKEKEFEEEKKDRNEEVKDEWRRRIKNCVY